MGDRRWRGRRRRRRREGLNEGGGITEVRRDVVRAGARRGLGVSAHTMYACARNDDRLPMQSARTSRVGRVSVPLRCRVPQVPTKSPLVKYTGAVTPKKFSKNAA